MPISALAALLILVQASLLGARETTCPPGCHPGRWSTEAIDLSTQKVKAPYGDRDIRVYSPDHQKSFRVVNDRWWVEVGGKRLSQQGESSALYYPAEVAWAPDSRAFVFTLSLGEGIQNAPAQRSPARRSEADRRESRAVSPVEASRSGVRTQRQASVRSLMGRVAQLLTWGGVPPYPGPRLPTLLDSVRPGEVYNGVSLRGYAGRTSPANRRAAHPPLNRLSNQSLERPWHLA